MGAVSSIFRSMMDRIYKQDFKILILGLDAAGKTSLLYKLKTNEN
jgi:GTPase SAR1 family protein